MTRSVDRDAAADVETAADGEPAGDVEPVTRRTHDTSWSANLEEPHHGEDRELVIAQAVDAVEATVPGRHVNLVTHGDHGHPETYLWRELEARLENRPVDVEYVDRCGCGGHVTRVHVREES